MVGERYLTPTDEVYVIGTAVPLPQQGAVALDYLRQRHSAPLESPNTQPGTRHHRLDRVPSGTLAGRHGQQRPFDPLPCNQPVYLVENYCSGPEGSLTSQTCRLKSRTVA